MIHRAKFQNFKALRDVEVTFDSRLTVLVGPNGSGKTSVLQGIHYLLQLAAVSEGDPDFRLHKVADFFPHVGSNGRVQLLAGGNRPDSGPYTLGISQRTPGLVRAVLEVPQGETPRRWDFDTTREYGSWQTNWHGPRLRPEDAASFDRSTLIRFSAARLARPSLMTSDPPLVDGDGTGLSAALERIQSKHPDRFAAIVEAFSRVIPGVTGIRFDKARVPGEEFYGDALVIDLRHVRGVNAAHVSSGTLFALGILTVLLSPESPNVVLLDDLDNGLHPVAQMELLGVFRTLLDRHPDLQIVATSHSPYILDKLDWDEVRVTALRDDGSADCKPLTDHPEIDRWREAMTPGEFWNTFYEDWVTRTPAAQSVP